MTLGPREERAAAEIEAALRVRDSSWSRRVDALASELDRRAGEHHRSGHARWLVVACLVGGLAFLLAAQQGWLSVELALVSGLPAASIRLALLVTAGTAALGAVLLLGRAALERFRGPKESVPDGESVATPG